MTYNFDADRWYEAQLAALSARRESGELDMVAYDAAVEELERRYEEMLDRLDRSYQINREPAR